MALYSALSTVYIDTSLNTTGLRLGVATIQACMRLETVTIGLNQYTLTIKLEVYKITTIRRSLSSVRLVEIYRNRLPSVLLTAYWDPEKGLEPPEQGANG